MTKAAFDAVTLEILWRRMISAADEAAKTLQRVSFSTLVNEPRKPCSASHSRHW